MAVQDSPTSIRVTWTPPSPLRDTTGYRISYTGGGGSSDSVDVDGGSTNSHTLMGLTNGVTYTISIVGTSSVLSSAPVEAGTVALSKAVYIHSKTNHPYSFNSTGARVCIECIYICLPVYIPMAMQLCAFLTFSPSSRAGECGSEWHNTHLHLPLLECGQWLSDQVRGGVERD